MVNTFWSQLGKRLGWKLPAASRVDTDAMALPNAIIVSPCAA
ncbi:MAG TPA: hypothetical protein VFK02_24400 [Kofleriaceae bacterium]|nr:hypothetical protein [Kofleriaceae bacterium]